MINKFKCKRCGWCCRNLVINIAYSDIVRWFNQGRNDILNEISWINNYPKENTGGFYITKTALNPKQSCPFLSIQNNAKCDIHDTKPRACRDAPLSYKEFDNCPSFKELEIDSSIKNSITKKQHSDFYLAHINRAKLLNMLIIARRETDGI